LSVVRRGLGGGGWQRLPAQGWGWSSVLLLLLLLCPLLPPQPPQCRHRGLGGHTGPRVRRFCRVASCEAPGGGRGEELGEQLPGAEAAAVLPMLTWMASSRRARGDASAETPRDSCTQLWSPQHRTELELWERGQRRPQQ